MKFHINIGHGQLEAKKQPPKNKAPIHKPHKKGAYATLGAASLFEDAIRRADDKTSAILLAQYGEALAFGVTASGKPRGWTLWPDTDIPMSPLELAAFSQNETIFLQILTRGASRAGFLMRQGVTASPTATPPMTSPVELAARFLGTKAITAALEAMPFVDLTRALVGAIHAGKAANVATIIILAAGSLRDRGAGQDSFLVDALTIGNDHKIFEHWLGQVTGADVSHKTATPMVALLHYIHRHHLPSKTSLRLLARLLNKLPDQLYEACGSNHDRPLHVAASLGLEAEARFIMSRDEAALRGLNGHGNTPLIEAILGQKPAMIDLLLNLSGSESLSAQNHVGVTALHAAAYHGMTAVVSAILKASPSARLARTSQGKRAIDLAPTPEIRAILA